MLMTLKKYNVCIESDAEQACAILKTVFPVKDDFDQSMDNQPRNSNSSPTFSEPLSNDVDTLVCERQLCEEIFRLAEVMGCSQSDVVKDAIELLHKQRESSA